MINTAAFSYINVLDTAADAGWIRNEAISNNIANATTPGYKRQDVAFDALLERALSTLRTADLDSRVQSLDLGRLRPMPYVDNDGYSYRLDGNNVDMDTESVALAENQIRYQGLLDSITREFQNLQMVMK